MPLQIRIQNASVSLSPRTRCTVPAHSSATSIRKTLSCESPESAVISDNRIALPCGITDKTFSAVCLSKSAPLISVQNAHMSKDSTIVDGEQNTNIWYYALMEEGRKRVVAIVAGIIVARHLDTADDLFGGPQGSPRTDKMVAAAVQWAERIMKKIDNVFGK